VHLESKDAAFTGFRENPDCYQQKEG